MSIDRHIYTPSVPTASQARLVEEMAGRGGNFISRVMQYVVNELLVDRLANSQSFQRFAVRSSRALEELAEKSAQKKAEIAQQMKEMTETFTNEVSKGVKDGRPPRKRRS